MGPTAGADGTAVRAGAGAFVGAGAGASVAANAGPGAGAPGILAKNNSPDCSEGSGIGSVAGGVAGAGAAPAGADAFALALLAFEPPRAAFVATLDGVGI